MYTKHPQRKYFDSDEDYSEAVYQWEKQSHAQMGEILAYALSLDESTPIVTSGSKDGH